MNWNREVYGHSVLGAPLEVFLPTHDDIQTIFVSSIHGDEPETTWVLARMMEELDPQTTKAAIILCANPDGMARSTRTNANGVDLNRNFPDPRWKPGDIKMYPAGTSMEMRATMNIEKTRIVSPGPSVASEPETKALIELCQKLNYPFMVNIHTPLNKLLWSGPILQNLPKLIAQRSGLPLEVQEHNEDLDVGRLQGSLRGWYASMNKSCLTYEFPYASLTESRIRHVTALKMCCFPHTWDDELLKFN